VLALGEGSAWLQAEGSIKTPVSGWGAEESCWGGSIPKSLHFPGSLLCPFSLDGHILDLNRCRFAPEESKVALNFVSGSVGR